MKKTTKSNCVTFGIVIAFYLLVELVSACGGIKKLLCRPVGAYLCVCDFGHVFEPDGWSIG